ncbi:hypothetical protein ACOJBM_24840 [Rhizobium beringeri]|uniref:hypothetical protein n=1 Tax=Rhizobium beringeri TaxID=3019934 RepID=UPI003B5A4BBC
MAIDRIWLARATYYFVADWINADIQTQERADLYMERLQEIAVSTAHFLSDDRESGQSFAEEDELLFDQFVKQAGLDAENSVKARNLRKGVLLLAEKLVDALENDPGEDAGNDPGCDPGGGVTDPDDRDKGDPW